MRKGSGARTWGVAGGLEGEGDGSPNRAADHRPALPSVAAQRPATAQGGGGAQGAPERESEKGKTFGGPLGRLGGFETGGLAPTGWVCSAIRVP